MRAEVTRMVNKTDMGMIDAAEAEPSRNGKAEEVEA